MMRAIFLFWFCGSLLLLAASHFRKDSLPDEGDIVSRLASAPIQEPVEIPPMTLQRGGRTYTINPLYRYELQGLVVSHHDSASWLDFAHKSWGDMLNVRDLCVVWGDNVKGNLYDQFSFKSGDFTCFFRTESSEAWSRFRQDQISNNHLLAGNPVTLRLTSQAETGDQVAFTGYLAEYSHDGGFSRGTSTTRDDTGNGACETVFVTDFEIIRKGNPFWRTAWSVSLASLPLSLAFGLAVFLTGAFMPGSPPLQSAETWHEKGLALAIRGLNKRAETALSKAIELDPAIAGVWLDRAMVREQLGLHEEAEQDRLQAERLSMLNRPDLG